MKLMVLESSIPFMEESNWETNGKRRQMVRRDKVAKDFSLHPSLFKVRL